MRTKIVTVTSFIIIAGGLVGCGSSGSGQAAPTLVTATGSGMMGPNRRSASLRLESSLGYLLFMVRWRSLPLMVATLSIFSHNRREHSWCRWKAEVTLKRRPVKPSSSIPARRCTRLLRTIAQAVSRSSHSAHRVGLPALYDQSGCERERGSRVDFL